jgi:hypothetical protein
VSQFLIDTAKRNIRGEITQAEVERLIEEYHSMCGTRKGIVARMRFDGGAADVMV